MVKSFKQMVKETVQRPKSPDEQAFLDQHTDNVNVKDYPAKESDDLIKKMKKDKTRIADREDDEEVYDQSYTEEPFDLEEKAESKAQAISARIALAVKRGKLPKSKLQGASKEMFKMSEKDLEDFTKEKKGAPYKVEEETLSEDPWEEIPMMERQLEFIAYAAEEIMEYLDMGIDPEEWFQNKLATAHDQIRTLHAYIEGDKRVRMAKMMGEGYRLVMKTKDNETMKSKVFDSKKAAEDAKWDAIQKNKKQPSNRQYKSIEIMKESVDLSEAVSAGEMKLNDGSTVTISKEDASDLNDMMKELNTSNQKVMTSRMMANKKGFDEILKFAKAAQ